MQVWPLTTFASLCCIGAQTAGAALARQLSHPVRVCVRLSCICPGRVHTPFVDGYLKKHHAGHEQEIYNKLAEWQPVGRMGRPEEIAALVLYLCSDEASFVTGAAYPIDGGRSSL